jgi:hypothetical protein
LTLIEGGDAEVEVPTKTNMSPFDYINFLVSCMYAEEDSADDIDGRHKYFISCFDDTTGILGGPYFKVMKVANNI